MGQDVEGEAIGDLSGRSVSLSGDLLAVGATLNDGNGNDAGHVRVYKWQIVTSAWEQLGEDIDGENAGDESGISVALSGNRIAVGAIHNGGGGRNSGHVRVFEWNGTAWTQMGTDLDGEAIDDYAGVSVALSDNRVAFGANLNDGNGKNSGQARVFEWQESVGAWTQMGGDIDGEAANDQSGVSVALDGNRVAVGAIKNDDSGADAGHTRVYEWQASTGAWTQMGADIDGEAAYDQSGVSVALDGNRVAVGANRNSGNGLYAGHVRVYRWNGTAWTQMGNDLDGEAIADDSGASVALSRDRVAIGAHYNDGNGDKSGHVRVYQWQESAGSWTQLGGDVDGAASNDLSGKSVALNGDRIAIGAIWNSERTGHARVYTWPPSTPPPAWLGTGAGLPASFSTTWSEGVSQLCASTTPSWQLNFSYCTTDTGSGCAASGSSSTKLYVGTTPWVMNGLRYNDIDWAWGLSPSHQRIHAFRVEYSNTDEHDDDANWTPVFRTSVPDSYMTGNVVTATWTGTAARYWRFVLESHACATVQYVEWRGAST